MKYRIGLTGDRLARTTRSIALLACGIGMALLLAGCETAPQAASASGAGTAATARTGGTAAQAHDRLIEAFNSCNEPAFLGAFAPLFSFATSNTKQVVTTREGLQRYLAVGCGSRPNPTAALVQQTTRVSGAVTVFSGQYRFKVPAGAQVAEVIQNFTLVMERMGERWLVLAQHVSVAP